MATELQTRGLGEFARWAFTLEREGDHLLLLMHEGECIAHYSQLGATPDSLQEECARHLVTKHGWDGCLWSRKT